jgi:hypothetical protein
MGGQPLASGAYTAVLVGGSDHGSLISSKNITVIRALDAGLSWAPYAGPNPAPAQGSPLFGRQLEVRFPAGELVGAKGELFNLAGEKVAESTDWNGTGTLWLSYEGRSSGVYVVSLSGRMLSGAPYRSTLKAAILR